MKRSSDHSFWLRQQIEVMRSSIALMDSGHMEIRVLHGSEWIDATPSQKPDIRERMWHLEKLLSDLEAR